MQLPLQTDLKKFKEFIESRDGEEGAWRGEVGEPLDQEATSPEEK